MRATRRVDPRGARRARCAGAPIRRAPRTRASPAYPSTRRCCRLRAVEWRPRGDTRRRGTRAMTARTATVTRATRETSITVTLTLEGTGKADVKTGLGFLDHLLEALIRHARFDVTLACRGDLHVDDHHTAEDCALALGQALDRALGERRGVNRFGWAYAPLDEALARAVVDLSGRSYADVTLGLRREAIGGAAGGENPPILRPPSTPRPATPHHRRVESGD